MATEALVILYTERLFTGTSSISRWAHRLAARFEAEAVRRAPKRTGDLAASISTDVDMYPGTKQVSVNLLIGSDHWPYVFYGTEDVAPIEPQSSAVMIFSNAFVPPHTRATEVAGQRRNLFLQTAHQATARRHPSIRGLRWSSIGARDQLNGQ